MDFSVDVFFLCAIFHQIPVASQTCCFIPIPFWGWKTISIQPAGAVFRFLFPHLSEDSGRHLVSLCTENLEDRNVTEK